MIVLNIYYSTINIFITPTGKKNETNFFNSDVKAPLKGLFPFDRTYRLETFVLQ